MASRSRPTTYVALLLGVNVGGNRKIAMTDLREWFGNAGAADVSTYIQSGNVIFTATTSRHALVDTIEHEIEKSAGFAVTVILRTVAELAKVVDDNPYPEAEAEPKTLHVVFFDGPPNAVVHDIDVAAFAPDELTVRDREIYLHLPTGIGTSKLAVAVTKGTRANTAQKGPSGTARNWNSVTKLLALARAAGEASQN